MNALIMHYRYGPHRKCYQIGSAGGHVGLMVAPPACLKTGMHTVHTVHTHIHTKGSLQALLKMAPETIGSSRAHEAA